MITTPILTRNERRILDAVLDLAGSHDEVAFSVSDLARTTGLHVGEVIAGTIRLREYGILAAQQWTGPRHKAAYKIDRHRLEEVLGE